MNHFTSLEVSKEMEKLGFEQDNGLFYYMDGYRKPVPFNRINEIDIICRAYLFTELLVIMQVAIGIRHHDLDTYLFFQDNPCDILAKILIALKKDGKL